MKQYSPKAEIWQNSKGNYCYRLQAIKHHISSTTIFWIMIIGFMIIIAEYLFHDSIYSGVILVPILFVILELDYFRPEKKREITEEKIINDLVNKTLEQDIRTYGNGSHEIQRKLIIETRGSYGIIDEEYLLVLLSDTTIIEYNLVYHKEESGFTEIQKAHICDQDNHKWKILNKKRSRWQNISLSTNTQLSLLILILITIGTLPLILFFLGLIWNVKYTFIILASYIFISMVLMQIFKGKNSKFSKTIQAIIAFPLEMVSFIQPSITILISYAYILIFTIGLPFLIINILDFTGILNITNAAKIFIILSGGSIAAVHYNYILQKFIRKHSILTDRGDHKFEPIRVDLALYVVEKENVKFIIYLMYFLFLIISGYMKIQLKQPLISFDIDEAILQAFIVFLAFDSMMDKSKNVTIDRKTLLEKTIKLMFTHDSNETK